MLLASGDWTSTRSAAVAAALVLITAAGVVRARALVGRSDARLRRRTPAAAKLRMLIAVLTLVLVVLAAVLAA